MPKQYGNSLRIAADPIMNAGAFYIALSGG